MKKFILSTATIAALFFTTGNLHAQDEEIEVETEVEMEQEANEFESIDVISLPQNIKDAVMTDYNDAVASEAWVMTKEDETKVYKLKLDVKGEHEEVFIDADGNWLKEEDID
ncbi:hypothetical protein [Christiangramia portivictoriae]|uniref:hypothetical protein n=1 Tax=Christiangramia portivictoriae TaxID=326069 RepID=UPI00041D001F|nr:hypothetical protein [Christiangramia portivictoriae]